MKRGVLVGLAAAVVLAILAGCGGGNSELRVSAAASLKRPFSGAYPDGVRLQFAGTDQLAAQIRRGARPDVLAAANTKIPAALAAAGLLEKPVPFASNRLVLAVPAGTQKVRSLADLERPGVSLAVGSPSVPVGAYTRAVLARLPPGRAQAILGHVRTEEPDVAGVVGKLAQGAVDAGFVYFSNVVGSGGRLRALELPARLRPRVVYAAAVVRGSPHPDRARRFVAGLLSGRVAGALRRAGFGPPGP